MPSSVQYLRFRYTRYLPPLINPAQTKGKANTLNVAEYSGDGLVISSFILCQGSDLFPVWALMVWPGVCPGHLRLPTSVIAVASRGKTINYHSVWHHDGHGDGGCGRQVIVKVQESRWALCLTCKSTALRNDSFTTANCTYYTRWSGWFKHHDTTPFPPPPKKKKERKKKKKDVNKTDRPLQKTPFVLWNWWLLLFRKSLSWK